MDRVRCELRRAVADSTAAARKDETSRDYFIALSEYQRRRVEPLRTRELASHELRVSSQNGEDGVIQEIMRRIGLPARPFFVEFGVETGSEGNAVLLADMCGWHGLFLEADQNDFQALARKYRHGPVEARQALVAPDNIEHLLTNAGVPADLDLLSIDIDGDDYWVWKALHNFRPRLLIIEYNPERPPHSVQEFGHGPWRGTSDFGASIEALIDLGTDKGYQLVHTDSAGANAFFIRSDMPGEWPESRITGTNYYMRSEGHPPAESPRPDIRV